MVICHCKRVSLEEIQKLFQKEKNLTLERVLTLTKSASVCGVCLRDVENIFQEFCKLKENDE